MGIFKREFACLSVLVLLVGLQAPVLQAAPDIQTWQTKNGAEVLFIEAQAIPIVDVRVTFAAGSARDGDKLGVALMTNALLTTGTGALDADAIAATLESVGAVLGNDALRDMALVSLRSLTEPEKLQTALSVMSAVISQPSFSNKDLERDRQRLLVGIQSKQQSPGSIAEDAFYKAIYGQHPYAQPSEGTAASVKALTRNDLLKFHRQYYVANNAVVAIVGDVKREQAEAIAEQLVQDLPAGEKAPALVDVADLSASEPQTIAMPTTQTHIVLGQPGMQRNDADFYDLYVGNHIFGGSGFASRIMQSIREDRGLAYSVYSYFLPMSQRGPFQMAMQTKNSQANEALALLKENLQSFIDKGPTKAELEASLMNITGGFPLRTDSNRKLVEYLAMIGFYDLPFDYLEKFNERVSQVTVESIQSAFQRRLQPENMVIIMVGGVSETSQP